MIKIYLYNLFKKIFSSNWDLEFFEKLSENISDVLLSPNRLDGQFILEKKNRTEEIEETVLSIMDVLIWMGVTLMSYGSPLRTLK